MKKRLAKIHGEGLLRDGRYEATPFPQQSGLFWLKELVENKDDERLWRTTIEQKLAKQIDAAFGGSGKSFKEAVQAALKQTLRLTENGMDFEKTLKAELRAKRAAGGKKWQK